MSRPNPEGEWVITQVPALRIVDDEMWQAVQTRYAGIQRKWTSAEPGKRFNQFVRPKYLFTGMTKCGECGAGFVVYSRDQLGCFGSRARGTCSNRLTIARYEVEERALTALQDKLLRQDFFDEFCREFTTETNRLRMEQRARLTVARWELERIEARRKKLVASIMDGVPAAMVKDELISMPVVGRPRGSAREVRRPAAPSTPEHGRPLQVEGARTGHRASTRRHAPRSLGDAPGTD